MPSSASPSASATTPPPLARSSSGAAFHHGVASGDPLADRVILWTRVTPSSLDAQVEVGWVLAEDPEIRRVVTRGRALATAARDHTIKVDVAGLAPGRAYYYRFEAAGARSAVGRTRTLPTADVSRLRLAYASCSNYPYGYFNAYGAIARRHDLHAVLHLGDYIYEVANGIYGDGTALGRLPDPADREIVSLADYRARHAIYKTDPDLQELHRQHPMIAVWDDHEFTNDAWVGGALNHQPDEGPWALRRAVAIQAYREWMPIRELPTAPGGQIYRQFRFGELLDLVMLDTRVEGRDQQADAKAEGFEATIADPRRTLLGFPQEAWLARQLERSKTDGVAWRVLGQQVLLGHIRPRALGDWVNVDMWDGYAPARQRLLDHLRARTIDDVVVLTGDIHSSWGLEIAADPWGRGYDPVTGRGALAVELVTPAISSPPPVRPQDAEARERSVQGAHPHIKWLELRRRGYVLLDIDRERVVAQWHLADSVDQREAPVRFARALAVERGKARLTGVPEATPSLTDAPEPAPKPS